MKSIARSLAHPGRTIAVTVAVAASLASPAEALAPGEVRTPNGDATLAASYHPYGFSPGYVAGLDYLSARLSFPTSFSIAVPRIDGIRTGTPAPNSFLLGLLGPGTYRLAIGGSAAGTSRLDSHSGMLRAVPAIAPTPEPEIWTMMLIGVGLVAIRLRQKSRLAGARHFS